MNETEQKCRLTVAVSAAVFLDEANLIVQTVQITRDVDKTNDHHFQKMPYNNWI